jgi:conjugal transfer/entry exclusion protein
VSHESNLEINIAEAMEQIEPIENEHLPVQRQISDLQQQLSRLQA